MHILAHFTLTRNVVLNDEVWHLLWVIISSLGLVLLHLYLYGWNVYAWQQTRINYAFIFEHRPGTELRYRQVLCMASGFTTLLLTTMNLHLYISTLEAPKFRTSEFLPLACILVWLLPCKVSLLFLQVLNREHVLPCNWAVPTSGLIKISYVCRYFLLLCLHQSMYYTNLHDRFSYDVWNISSLHLSIRYRRQPILLLHSRYRLFKCYKQRSNYIWLIVAGGVGGFLSRRSTDEPDFFVSQHPVHVVLLHKWFFPWSSEWCLRQKESLQRVGVLFLHAPILVPFPTSKVLLNPKPDQLLEYQLQPWVVWFKILWYGLLMDE